MPSSPEPAKSQEINLHNDSFMSGIGKYSFGGGGASYSAPTTPTFDSFNLPSLEVSEPVAPSYDFSQYNNLGSQFANYDYYGSYPSYDFQNIDYYSGINYAYPNVNYQPYNYGYNNYYSY